MMVRLEMQFLTLTLLVIAFPHCGFGCKASAPEIVTTKKPATTTSSTRRTWPSTSPATTSPNTHAKAEDITNGKLREEPIPESSTSAPEIVTTRKPATTTSSTRRTWPSTSPAIEDITNGKLREQPIPESSTSSPETVGTAKPITTTKSTEEAWPSTSPATTSPNTHAKTEDITNGKLREEPFLESSTISEQPIQTSKPTSMRKTESIQLDNYLDEYAIVPEYWDGTAEEWAKMEKAQSKIDKEESSSNAFTTVDEDITTESSSNAFTTVDEDITTATR
ncbi:hypothetical protein SprV_0602169400 [Sparganum proliferum]